MALEGLLLEARLLPRLAGGGLVLGVVEASREGRLLGREDASAFGLEVVTDKAGARLADLVTIFLGLVGPLGVVANEEVLIGTVAGLELEGLAPNFARKVGVPSVGLTLLPWASP